MRWKTGRQGTGYKVLTLIEKGFRLFNLLGFDCHIIKYDKGHSIPPHKDGVTVGKHYRLNIVLRQPKVGHFRCQKAVFMLGWNGQARIVIFRPDRYRHSVSACDGTRLVFSFGWVLK